MVAFIPQPLHSQNAAAAVGLLHLGGALLRLQAIVVLVDDGQDVEDTGGDEDLESNLFAELVFSTGRNLTTD